MARELGYGCCLFQNRSAHKGNDVGAGVISTIFSDLDLAKQYKQSLIEQREYSAADIQIVSRIKINNPLGSWRTL